MRQNNLQPLQVLLQEPTQDHQLHRKVEELLQESLQQEALTAAVEVTIRAALLQEVMVEADRQLNEIEMRIF